MMSVYDLFKYRIGVIATMHEKERVMAPIIEKNLGIEVYTPDQLNTDMFGTFTRDIERKGDQIEAARHKALQALQLTGESIAFASEGVFSPHPLFPFATINREIVLFVDQKNEIEIVGESVSLESCYYQKKVTNVSEAFDFAQNSGFPEHGIVVMVNEKATQPEDIYKGIKTKERLTEAVNEALSKSVDGTIHMENDLRAHQNPTRMKNIEKATQTLVETIKRTCPSCQWPGFQVSERRKGLPCAGCGQATNHIRSVVFSCQKCNYKEEQLSPDGKQYADPATCGYCNP